MNRKHALVQGLKAKLSKRKAWMERASYSTVSFSSTDTTLSVHLTWTHPTPGQYTHTFDEAAIFGELAATQEPACLRKCIGDYARDVVRATLQQRMGA